MKLILSLLIIIFLSSVSKETQALAGKEGLYREAQREFRKKNYPKSLDLFMTYIDKNKTRKIKPSKEQVLWSIDIVSRIHIGVNKDSVIAIFFLERIIKNVSLDEAEKSNIFEWISVIKEWKKLNVMPTQVKTKEELVKYGQKYYLQGMDRIQFPADDSGNIDFYIATIYLEPYVYRFDSSANTGKALFILGNIKSRSWNDYDYWSENFYLKEVIRRYPYSNIARKAYESLEKGIRAGYSGTDGDKTPPSQVIMLEALKKLTIKKDNR